MTPKVATVNPKLQSPAREAGFTLVEMMVGVLIGLVAIIVMFQVFAVSEAQKRTTAGAGEAQQNGVTSLFLMQRDARMAGYGLGYLQLLGCQTNFYYIPTNSVYSIRMLPINIVNGAGGTAPDTVTFLYGSTDTFQMPAAIQWNTSPLANSDPAGKVKIGEGQYQFQNGDLIVLGDAPLNPTRSPIFNAALGTAGSAPMCTLFQVTHQKGGDGLTEVYFNDFAFTDENTGANVPAEYNPPGGSMPAPNNYGYPKWSAANNGGGRITNLGREPTANQYYVQNNQLMVRNLFRPNLPPVVVADGVVQFQAQYGYSSACPNLGPPYTTWTPTPSANAPAGYQPPCSIAPTAASVAALVTTWPPGNNRDMWTDFADPAVLTPMNWRQIVAMRFVIVARSINQEKVDKTTGVCNATQTMPVWSVNNMTLDISSDANWKCYRYRTYEGTVPIRNMIWSPDPLGSPVPPA
jgi:type IV pilus assembly protein PilW